MKRRHLFLIVVLTLIVFAATIFAACDELSRETNGAQNAVIPSDKDTLSDDPGASGGTDADPASQNDDEANGGSVVETGFTLSATVSESSPLAISWDRETLDTSLSSSVGLNGLNALIPSNSSVGTSFGEIVYQKVYCYPVNGELIFRDPESLSPYIFDREEKTSFLLSNLSQGSQVSNLRVQAAFECESGGESALSTLRVGIFKKDNSGNFTLQGVLAPTPAEDNVAYGTITSGASVNTISMGRSVREVSLGSVSSQGEVECMVAVWLDAAAYDDMAVKKAMRVSLLFVA